MGARTLLAAALLALAGGCVDDAAVLAGTTSLRVEITDPVNLGSDDVPLCPVGSPTVCADRDVTVKITALDEEGAVDTSVNGELDLYAHFLGTLTPDQADHIGLASVQMEGGAATATVTLSAAFGPTRIWAEDVVRQGATFATGVSEPIRYDDPVLTSISTPRSLDALDALSASPLEGKQVTIAKSQFGASGRLVVTGVYAQGYTLSDVDLTTHTAPDFGHAFIFTFGRPTAAGGTIEVGSVIAKVSGGVSEFNGFTEVSFPTSALAAEPASLANLPAPIDIQAAWLATGSQAIELEKHESALVRAVGVICPTAGDANYTKFAQWKIDVNPDAPCTRPISVITKGQVSMFDPALQVGKQVEVTGTLKAVNLGSLNVWIVLPRSMADIKFI